MDSPLRERLRWRNTTDEDVEATATRATLARTAAVLTGLGALICLIGALVPGDAEVCCMNTVAIPLDSEPSSGTASRISDVTRWKPRGRAPSWISRCIHTARIVPTCSANGSGGISEPDIW
jgi:hypothetical protein